MDQNTDDTRKTSTTKSIAKALAILSTFNEASPVQRTSEIAMKLDMNISTVSRHLNTMLDLGFLERDEATGYYSPGLEIITLAGVALQNNALFRHTYPELQHISDQYGVHTHMGVPRDTNVIHLISFSYKNTPELLIPMGHSHPMYCSAMGRAILAYSPESVVQKILKNSDLKKYTPDTRTDFDDINEELVLTRQRGYCLLSNELVENKASISAPIFDRNRNPIAAISVSTSSRSLANPERRQDLAKVIIRTAGKISGKLGYFPK